MNLLSLEQIVLLPFRCFSHRYYLPHVAAVYFVFTDQNDLAYIGRTIDLHNRWIAHHRVSQMQPTHRIYWIEIADDRARSDAELHYIALLQPPWNGANIPIALPKPPALPYVDTHREMRVSAATEAIMHVGTDPSDLRAFLEEFVRIAESDAMDGLASLQDAAHAWSVTPRRANAHIAKLHERYGIGRQLGGAWVLRRQDIEAHRPDQRFRAKT